jgi:hypothetical protein
LPSLSGLWLRLATANCPFWIEKGVAVSVVTVAWVVLTARQGDPKWTQIGPKDLFVLSRCLPSRKVPFSCKCLSFIRRHVEGVAVLLQSFLPYSIEGGRWSASCPGRCTTGKISVTHFIRSPFGLRYSADYGEKTLNVTGIWTVNLPARSLVAVLTALSGSVLSVLKYICPWPCGSLISTAVGSVLLKHRIGVYRHVWPPLDWNLTVPLALNGAH